MTRSKQTARKSTVERILCKQVMPPTQRQMSNSSGSRFIELEGGNKSEDSETFLEEELLFAGDKTGLLNSLPRNSMDFHYFHAIHLLHGINDADIRDSETKEILLHAQILQENNCPGRAMRIRHRLKLLCLEKGDAEARKYFLHALDLSLDASPPMNANTHRDSESSDMLPNVLR